MADDAFDDIKNDLRKFPKHSICKNKIKVQLLFQLRENDAFMLSIPITEEVLIQPVLE